MGYIYYLIGILVSAFICGLFHTKFRNHYGTYEEGYLWVGVIACWAWPFSAVIGIGIGLFAVPFVCGEHIRENGIPWVSISSTRKWVE